MSAYEDWCMVGRFEDEENLYEEELMYQESFKAKIDEIVKEGSSKQISSIRPLQLMNQISEALSRESDLFGKIFNVQGIFKLGSGFLYGNGYYYDNIKDENSAAQIKILVSPLVRQKVKPDSLVVLSGMLIKNPDAQRGVMDIMFRVDSVIEEIKSKAINDEDLKRISLIQKKNEKGKEPVRALLKNKLMSNNRPKVCIIYAQTSITDQDFNKGVQTAGSQIDFTMCKAVSFADTPRLIQTLKYYDTMKYDTICLVRGGGSGMDKLDDVRLFECLLNMNTPVIGAVGHVGENYSIHSMVDENAGTPSLLGQYFDILVKETAMEREGTINDLANKIKETYKPQLERLAVLEKSSKEDKEKIDRLFNERQKTILELAKVNNDMLELKKNQNEQVEKAKLQMANQIRLWRIIAVICFIIAVIVSIFL